MRNIIVLSIIVVFAVPMVLSGGVLADEVPDDNTNYTISVYTENNTIVSKANVELTSETSDSNWRLSWDVGKESEVMSVRTTQGNIEYNRDGEIIEISEKRGEERHTETFTIVYKYKYQEGSVGANTVTLALSGLRGDFSEAKITIKGSEALVLNRFTNHSITKNPNSYYLSGTGPITAVIRYEGVEPSLVTEHYKVYGSSNLDKEGLESAYVMNTKVTGVSPEYNKIPIIVVKDKEYEEVYGGEVSGVWYKGAIILPESTLENKPTVKYGVIAHETTHAFNTRVSPLTPIWFNEGTAELVEREYRREHNGELEEYDSPDRAWEYNNEEKVWLYDWAGSESSTEEKRFAYDYTRGYMISYVEDNSHKMLLDTYKRMISDNHYITPEQDDEYILTQLNESELRYCDLESQDETENCVLETNEKQIEIQESTNLTSALSGKVTNNKVEYDKEPPESEFNIVDVIIDIVRWVIDILIDVLFSEHPTNV